MHRYKVKKLIYFHVSKGEKATQVPIPLINVYHKNIKNDHTMVATTTTKRKPAKCLNNKKMTKNTRVYSQNGTQHGH